MALDQGRVQSMT